MGPFKRETGAGQAIKGRNAPPGLLRRRVGANPPLPGLKAARSPGRGMADRRSCWALYPSTPKNLRPSRCPLPIASPSGRPGDRAAGSALDSARVSANRIPAACHPATFAISLSNPHTRPRDRTRRTSPRYTPRPRHANSRTSPTLPQGKLLRLEGRYRIPVGAGVAPNIIA